MTTIEFKGLKELDAALRELPNAMQAAPVRAGLKAAGGFLAAGMARRAPRDVVLEGVTLADEIVWRARVSNARDTAVVEIGPSRRAYYGMFQELGTAHHRVRPFMRPTLHEDAVQAIAIFAIEMRAGLARAARRLARMRGAS